MSKSNNPAVITNVKKMIEEKTSTMSLDEKAIFYCELVLSSDVDEITKAYATHNFILSKFYISDKEAVSAIKTAEKIFLENSKSNKLFNRCLRQFFITKGIYYARCGKDREAFLAYEKASMGSKSKDVVATAKLNTAKLHIARGEWRKALVVASSVDPKDLDETLSSSLKLVKSRILLTFGYEKASTDQLPKSLTAISAHTVEKNYLSLMASCIWDGDWPGDEVLDFLDSIEGIVSSRGKYFYELEFHVYERLSNHKAFKNKRHFDTRLKYLADKAKDSRFLRFGLSLSVWLKSKSEQDFSDMLLKLKDLKRFGNDIAYQNISMLLIKYCLYKLKKDWASIVAFELTEFLSARHVVFSGVKGFNHLNSNIEDKLEELISNHSLFEKDEPGDVDWLLGEVV